MHETYYRASRVCRVLGNPTAYQIIKNLQGRRKTPYQLAEEIGISLPLVSVTLRTLRNIDVVRYETRGKEKVYWIKDVIIHEVCNLLEKFVGRMRHKNW